MKSAFLKIKPILASSKSGMLNNFIFNFSGTVGTRLLSLCANILIAKTFGEEVFGRWSIFLGITLTVVQLAIPNMATVVVSQIAQLREKSSRECSEMFGFLSAFVITAALIASGLNYFFSDSIAYLFGGDSSVGPALRWFSIPLFLLIITGFLRSCMLALESFKLSCVSDLVQPLIFVILLATFSGWNRAEVLRTIILCYSASLFCALLFTLYVSNKLFITQGLKYVFVVRRSHFHVLWHYSAPGLVAASARGPIDIYTKSRLTTLDGGWAILGGVQAGLNLYMFVAFIPMIICRVIAPRVNVLKIQKNYRMMKQIFIRSAIIAFVVSVALSLLMLCFGKLLLGLYGDEFVSYYPALALLLAVGCIESVDSAVQPSYAVFECMWLRTSNLVLGSLLFLLITPALIKGFGIYGYCYALIIARGFGTIVTIVITVSYYKKFKLNCEKNETRN